MMDEVSRARDKAIAMAIVDGLKEQHIRVQEAQEILYLAQDLIRESQNKQSLTDMLKSIL